MCKPGTVLKFMQPSEKFDFQLERRIKLTVSKGHPSLCERCSAKGSSIQLADSVFAHVTPVIAKSSSSSPSVECTRPHPQQENAESESSENPKNEVSAA
uniref:MSP domain-containing protein n=1 Tax=Angiostrongylus cantonensis TaxID=6313 RepID=A0A0K0D511_ANGCA